MISIRSITNNDFEKVSKLLLQLGYKATPYDLKIRIERINSHEKGNVFVAETDSNEIIGCVQALIDTRFAGGSFGEIVSLVVDESYRGKGIGKKLIDTAADWLKQKGEKTLRIRCNVIRDETHKFYEHLGFIEKKKQKIFEKSIE